MNKLLKQVAESNILTLTMKAEQKKREKEEDEKIYEYIKQKDIAEYERQMEEKRIKEEKEKELKKMRDL